MKILIIGGYGMFGERFCRIAAAIDGLHLLIAGRNIVKARLLADELRQAHENTQFEGVRFDLSDDLDQQLQHLNPDMVINTAGPFQALDYAVPEAAIGRGIHYLDIADGRHFVNGIHVLDAKARAAGVCVLSGASTIPSISSAALDQLVSGWHSVFSIEMDLVVNSRMKMGLSLLEAALSYAGKPVEVFNNGRIESHPGWSLLKRQTYPLMGSQWTSLCDVPDLEIARQRFKVRHRVLFRAGSGSAFTQFGLWLASMPVRWGWIGSLVKYARPMAWLQRLFRPLGPALGGLSIRACGIDEKAMPREANWMIAAPPTTGPNIPILSLIALVRRFQAGKLEFRGAGPCVGILDLEDILPELDGLSIPVVRHAMRLPHPPLYRRCLGEDFDKLPEAIREGHEVRAGLIASGRAKITGGTAIWHRVFRKTFGFPEPGEDVPVTVVMEQVGEAERWTRFFGDSQFFSQMSCPEPGYLVETFGPIGLKMRIDADAAALSMHLVGWSIWGMPLPLFLAPAPKAVERLDKEGRFTFEVSLDLPIFGRLAGYQGWLRIR